MPHMHIGLSAALTIVLLWVLVTLPLKVLAVSPLLNQTRIGQALAFAL